MRNRARFCYAQTLMEIARERQSEARYAEELARFAGMLRQDPVLKQRLEDPLTDREEKKGLLDQTSRKALFDPIIGNFLQVMLDQRHEKDFEAVIEVFQDLADAEKGILRGVIQTAQPMSSEQIGRLEAVFSKRLNQTVVLNQRPDPGLIGGLRVELAGRIYDGTLQSRLSDFFLEVSGDPGKAVSFRKNVAAMDNAARDSLPPGDQTASEWLNAEVRSAVPLTDAQQTMLAAALSKKFGKEIRLSFRLQPGLLGGMVVRVGDTVCDGSISRRLEDLKKAMLQ